LIKVQLDGETIDLQDLEEVLRGLQGYEWEIIKEDERYYLCNGNIDQIIDARDTVEVANKVIRILNGISNVLYPNHHIVKAGQFIFLDQQGRKHNYLFAEPAKYRTRVRGTLTDANGAQGQNEPYSHELVKAASNVNVRDALYFFSEPTWFNLYKVYEVIRADIRGSTKELKDYVQEDDLSKFTYTANSRDAIGDLSRHGKIFPVNKEKELTLYKSQLLVRRLIEAWVKDKYIKAT